MELEEMKHLWKIQEKKLDQILRFNREVFIKLKKSRYNIRKPLITEIISLVVLTGIIISVAALSIHLYRKPEYSISGFVAVTLSTVYLFFSVRRYKMLTKLDMVNTDMMTLQKELAILESFTLRARKTELGLLPLFIITLMPVIFIELAGINLYNNLVLFGAEAAIILVFGYAIGNRIKRKIYAEKLEQTGIFLAEIRNFETE
jgi:multisubunit Na+/H+ antiporter MnhB subunit